MVRDELQVPVVVAHRGVDVEAQIARMKVVVQRGDQRLEAGLRMRSESLQSRARARDSWGWPQERYRPAGRSWRVRASSAEKVANLGDPDALSGVVVVDQRKDVEVDVVRRDGAGDLGLAIDLMNCAMVDDRDTGCCRRRRRSACRRRDDVQPLGKQEVDLADVLLQRGVAGRVVFDVVRRAQTFARVQGNVAGLDVGFAVGRAAQLLNAAAD